MPFACKTCNKSFAKHKIDNPQEVAETFNKWFKEKIETLIKKIDKSDLEDPFERLKSKMANRKLSFSLSPVDVREVLEVLKYLKPKTSCGPDGISSEMIKMCKEELAGPLTLIINRSICSGVFPLSSLEFLSAPFSSKSLHT